MIAMMTTREAKWKALFTKGSTLQYETDNLVALKREGNKAGTIWT